MSDRWGCSTVENNQISVRVGPCLSSGLVTFVPGSARRRWLNEFYSFTISMVVCFFSSHRLIRRHRMGGLKAGSKPPPRAYRRYLKPPAWGRHCIGPSPPLLPSHVPLSVSRVDRDTSWTIDCASARGSTCTPCRCRSVLAPSLPPWAIDPLGAHVQRMPILPISPFLPPRWRAASGPL